MDGKKMRDPLLVTVAKEAIQAAIRLAIHAAFELYVH
jgi:hypothetical protein